jgi:pilus assembly protein Flp/PilA
MKRLWIWFRRRQEGASLVEYGLLVALIAVVCLLAVTALGISVRDVFNNIAGAIAGAGAAP